jgi:hypothetical protein
MLLTFMVIEPFLNLSREWTELTIGLALTSFSVFMMLATVVMNRMSWPRKWRLHRSLPGRLRPFTRLAALMFGDAARNLR